MTEHPEIWLQPWCKDCELNTYEGRLWCHDDVWGKCDENEKCKKMSVRYVLALPQDE